MTLPKPGARVRVWPLHPRVQSTDHPVGAAFAGRFMEPEGHDVIWSHFHVALLRGGAIALHDPRPLAEIEAEKAAAEATAQSAPVPAAPIEAEPEHEAPIEPIEEPAAAVPIEHTHEAAKAEG